MNNFDNCNTKLNASPGSNRDLSLRMICNVPRSPSTSIEQENDASGTKVRCKVRDVVRSVVVNDLLRCERSNVV